MPRDLPIAYVDQRGKRFEIFGLRKIERQDQPWLYARTDARYARDWPYTLLIHHGGFMQRFYDWEGRLIFR